jgi:colanic acid/amylovoran biosynthesis protein
VLIGGSQHYLNLGEQARLRSSLKMLKKMDVGIEFTLLSHNFEVDSRLLGNDGVTIIRAPWQRNPRQRLNLALMAGAAILAVIKYSLFRLLNGVLKIPLKGKLQGYDAFMELSGITFSEYVYTESFIYSSYLLFLFGLVMGIPIICFAQTIGPVKGRLKRTLVRFLLNRTRLITLRDENSKSHLENLAINKPRIEVTADPAFLLEPVNREKVQEILINNGIKNNNRPLIAVSPSPQPFAAPDTAHGGSFSLEWLHQEGICKLSQIYIEKMVSVVDWLTGYLGATVLFIPQSTIPQDDDREVIEKIMAKVNGGECIRQITTDLNAEEAMAIIRECDLLISLRMHFNIFAACVNVPSVAIIATNSPRTPGVLRMAGLEQYVCNILKQDVDDIINVINDAWKNRERIREMLKYRIPLVQSQALLNAKFFAQIIL